MLYVYYFIENHTKWSLFKSNIIITIIEIEYRLSAFGGSGFNSFNRMYSQFWVTVSVLHELYFFVNNKVKSFL